MELPQVTQTATHENKTAEVDVISIIEEVDLISSTPPIDALTKHLISSTPPIEALTEHLISSTPTIEALTEAVDIISSTPTIEGLTENEITSYM